MAFLLRDGLAFCLIDRRPVFLDILRDRYFLLRPAHEEEFLRTITGEAPLDAQMSAEVLRVLRLDRPPQAIGAVPVHTSASQRPLTAYDAGRAPIASIMRAVAAQIGLERQIRRRPLTEVVRRLAMGRGQACLIAEAQRKLIAAHRMAGLIRTVRGRCLPTSFALAQALARTACFPDVILGVALSPFRAHCWLQHGDMVLNDAPDHVRSFTPILIL